MVKNYSDIKFEKFENSFKHNLDADFACFVLWKSARSYRDRIRELLSSQFEILLETEIVWSKEHFHDNAARLYEAPIYKNISKENRQSNHAAKIGDNTFILFVVRDLKPFYTYGISVSNKIEMSNMNIVRAKYEIRDWVQKDLNVKYAVHSTNNIHEFFFQAPLLLGVDLFERLLNAEKLEISSIEKDLEGAAGWKDYTELFKILNLTSNYLIQRGFESLPLINEDKDLDLLTDNYQRLASAMGANQSSEMPFKGHIFINNERVTLDIRFVGDKYYDISWQKDMLINKIKHSGLFVPREDDYFFSLLFHCKVQKKEVKQKYIGILEKIAENLSFTWYTTELLFDDQKVGRIIKGYFQSQGYYYEHPIDGGVYKNTEIIKFLPVVAKKNKLKELIIRFVPKKILRIIIKIVK